MSEHNFPFDIRPVDGAENKDLQKHFQGLKYIRIGPKNYFLTNGYKNEAAYIYNMPLRPDDVFVASFPRSGTTWTQELVWLLANNLDYTTATNVSLQKRYFFLEQSMFMTEEMKEKILKENAGNTEKNPLDDYDMPHAKETAEMPSPRFLKTHLPMSLLPPALLDTTKVVYVARDPRDVAVSYYHLSKLFKVAEYLGDFKSYWRFFIKDMVNWAPFFEHLKEAWRLRNHPNLLFLFYEELSKDLPATVQRVADFLGKKITQEQLTELCSHLSIDNFKKNSSVNYDEAKNSGILSSKESFIRKGKSGGWRDSFDEEMTREADTWIAKNLEDTDLRFPSML